jgi:putative transposase
LGRRHHRWCRDRIRRPSPTSSINAAVESFFATLKRELAWIHATKTWPTRTALRSALFDHIEGFYNPGRIQHRLEPQSPINYEQDSAA